MGEMYQKVAYIGLRNSDGSYQTNVPLYVKVNEVNKNGLTDMQEELMHKISNIMLQHYQQRFSEFIQSKKAAYTQQMTQINKGE